MQSDILEERYAIIFCFNLEKNATEMYWMFQTSFRPSYMNRASVFEWAVRKSIHLSWFAKGFGLGLLFWGFKGVQEEIHREDQHSLNRVSDISSRTIHQTTTLSLSPTIWPRWASRQFWENERGCNEGHWYAHTRGRPWGLPEVVGMLQVHCSMRRLIRRGLEFHVCAINKSGQRKKSGNLSYAPRMDKLRRVFKILIF